jgi:Mg-chelatase subunit ChlD
MTDPERLRRWRLVLGSEPAGCLGVSLSAEDARMDDALEALYDAGQQKGGLGGSNPKVARWLGDIRRYFPSEVVQVMQKDAIERLDLKQLLLEPEVLDPGRAGRASGQHADLAQPHHPGKDPRDGADGGAQAGRPAPAQARAADPPGGAGRAVPQPAQPPPAADGDRLAPHDPREPAELPAGARNRTIVPETLIGYGRRRSSLRDVVLCIDQSGSMAPSVVYSSIFGAVMASMPALSTRFVLFDTAVVDLTNELNDPVDLLFGTQLGGGTDIHKALTYCESQITRPADTVMVLVSDLCEGGSVAGMMKTAERLKESGVQLIALLALSDEGKPWYDAKNAAAFAAMDIPVFACTPDRFPDLMAAALAKKDLKLWAAGGRI